MDMEGEVRVGERARVYSLRTWRHEKLTCEREGACRTQSAGSGMAPCTPLPATLGWVRPPFIGMSLSLRRCEQEQQRCRDLEARLASLEERERAARSQPLPRVSSLSANLSLPAGFGGSHTSLKREMYAAWAVGAAGGIPPLTRCEVWKCAAGGRTPCPYPRPVAGQRLSSSLGEPGRALAYPPPPDRPHA